jgi:hypothetical protein
VADLQATRGDIEAYDMDGNISARTNGGMIRCDRIKGGLIRPHRRRRDSRGQDWRALRSSSMARDRS